MIKYEIFIGGREIMKEMENKVDAGRKAAVIVGVLFLIALFFNLIAMAIYGPILDAPDYLLKAYPNRIQVILGVLIDFICVPAIVLIPVVLFPVLKPHNERLALGYVGFRFLEVVFFIVPLIKSLSLIDLSREYINAGAADGSFFQILGGSIHAQNDWTTLFYIIIFTLGALMFYRLLYKSRLLPRFISIWGLISAALLLAGAVVGMFDIIPLSNVMVMFGPVIALNELVLAIWLIVKGFNPAAIDTV
jgi:hypothetical protein